MNANTDSTERLPGERLDLSEPAVRDRIRGDAERQGHRAFGGVLAGLSILAVLGAFGSLLTLAYRLTRGLR